MTKHTILTLACLGVVAVQPAAPQATPQASVDPYFTSSGTWGQPADDQWAIKQVGFTGGADSAWSLAGTDLEPVNVAVIDTGLDWHHLDVDAENIWRNEGETPYNNIDDDGNGYVDDVIGWNFFGRNGDAWDHDGHGTMVAGIIAARRGNGVGIAGINPAARIMVLKGVNNFGHTRASYVAEAIKYAVDNGARIINMSLAGPDPTEIESAAIDYAVEHGVLIVAAAGNEGSSLAERGVVTHPGVLVVAATDFDDQRAGFSNWGPQIAISAPGLDVLSLRARRTDTMRDIPGIEYEPGSAYVGEDRRYYRASGTSFAAPIVTGVASLLLAKNPSLSLEQLKRMLLHSARDIETPGLDQVSGYGLLDARAALQADPAFFIESIISSVGAVQEGSAVVVQVSGTADADRFTEARVEIGMGETPESWTQVGTLSDARGPDDFDSDFRIRGGYGVDDPADRAPRGWPDTRGALLPEARVKKEEKSVASQDKRIPALLSIGTSLMLLLAFPAPVQAVIGAVRIAAVQDTQQVAQVTITILQGDEVVAERDTDKSGVAMIPLEEGQYTVVTEHAGTSIRADITVEAGALASFTADFGRGVLQTNDAPLNRYNPLEVSNAEDGYEVSTADFDGLFSARVQTPDGLIFLGFPYQLLEGGRMSWSAILLPAGETADDREESAERLSQHDVQINEQLFSLQESLTWTTVVQASATVALIEDGKTMIQFHFTFEIRSTLTRSVVTSDGAYFATAQWPVGIPGTFDGDAGNTSIDFAGSSVEVVAETPSMVYFNPPPQPVGLQPVTISDMGRTQDCMVRSAGLELWADKYDLLTGEGTSLHLKISGLAGLPGIVFVALFNNSITVVSMGRGNYQFFIINPGGIGPGGVVQYDRTLTGIHRGLFNIVAILMQL